MDGAKWQILLKNTDIRQITMSRNVKYYFYLLLVFLRYAQATIKLYSSIFREKC